MCVSVFVVVVFLCVWGGGGVFYSVNDDSHLPHCSPYSSVSTESVGALAYCVHDRGFESLPSQTNDF